MLEEYRKHVAERAAEGIVPKPLDATQMAALVELLKNPPKGEEEFLLDLLINRVPPGVDEAAYVKAGFLAAVAKGEAKSPLIDRKHATELLGTMQGGYNIETLVALLDDAELGAVAAEQLKHTLLMFDAFHDVAEKAKAGNVHAKAVLESWAAGEWFTSRPAIADKYTADSLLANLAKIPLPGLTPRVLVCVGSGLGNICHTTPMIRALATAIGAPVDVEGLSPSLLVGRSGEVFIGDLAHPADAAVELRDGICHAHVVPPPPAPGRIPRTGPLVCHAEGSHAR